MKLNLLADGPHAVDCDATSSSTDHMEMTRGRRSLANGLRVVVERVPGVYGCGIAVNYRAGFRTEPRYRAGMAHLFEHMMFQGSENVAKGEHFATILGSGGSANGLTFHDVVDFHETVPVGELENVLTLECDRMSSLILSEDNLATQRNVVNEEVLMRVKGKPYGGFPWTVLPDVQYDKWENTHNGFGTLDDISRISLTACREFYSSHYAPANAVVAVAGDIAIDDVLDAVSERFEKIPYREPATPPVLSEQVGGVDRYGACYDELAGRPAVAIGVRLPGVADDMKRYAAHLVLSHLLTTGSRGRLKSRLEEFNAQVASSVGFFGPGVASDPDTFVLVSRHPSGMHDTVVGAIDDEMRAVADEQFTERELERARALASVGLYQALDLVGYRARSLARGELLWDMPAVMERLVEVVEGVAGTDVAACARGASCGAGRAILKLYETAKAM